MSISPEKLSTIRAWLNKAPSRVALASGACHKPGAVGFQPASKTEQIVAEIGPVDFVQRRGSFVKMGQFSSRPCEFLIEAPPHRDPLADLFGSGGNLRHPPFTEEPCDRGVSANLGFARRRTLFSNFCTSR